jgi:hypothetical protein
VKFGCWGGEKRGESKRINRGWEGRGGTFLQQIR